MRFLYLILLTCVAMADTASTLRPEVNEALDRAIELEHQGKIREAEQTILNVIRDCRDESLELGAALNNLAVLYLGAVMEMSSRDEIFRSPLHPYTVALLSAAPSTDPSKRARSHRIILEGEVPQMTSQVKGCRFKDRCPIGRDRTICETDEPPLREVARNHWISCHFPGELRPQGVSEQSEDARGGRGPASRPSPDS